MIIVADISLFHFGAQKYKYRRSHISKYGQSAERNSAKTKYMYNETLSNNCPLIYLGCMCWCRWLDAYKLITCWKHLNIFMTSHLCHETFIHIPVHTVFRRMWLYGAGRGLHGRCRMWAGNARCGRLRNACSEYSIEQRVPDEIRQKYGIPWATERFTYRADRSCTACPVLSVWLEFICEIGAS